MRSAIERGPWFCTGKAFKSYRNVKKNRKKNPQPKQNQDM